MKKIKKLEINPEARKELENNKNNKFLDSLKNQLVLADKINEIIDKLNAL